MTNKEINEYAVPFAIDVSKGVSMSEIISNYEVIGMGSVEAEELVKKLSAFIATPEGRKRIDAYFTAKFARYIFICILSVVCVYFARQGIEILQIPAKLTVFTIPYSLFQLFFYSIKGEKFNKWKINN